MERSLILFGYNKMIESLTAHALSQGGKALCGQLRPLLSEIELEKQLRDTTQARMFLDLAGTPPLPLMEGVEEYLDRAVLGELLAPEQIGAIGQFLTAVSRLKRYLEKGQEKQIGLAFYGENLDAPEELREEIARCIRGDEVDDYASAELREIRRQLQLLEEKVREKAEQAKRASQTWLNDSFVVTRNGRFCLPVRAEYKAKVPGTVVDKSATGATLFIEPKAVGKLQEEYEWCRIAEDSEERRILYALGGQIADLEPVLREDIRVITMLDFVFAKGKLSQEMDGIEPVICQERRIRLKEARHPMLEKETVVPLDFDGGDGVRGVVITGPNTGGKTVALKTVALLCAMAGSGLHIPCKEAKIPMHNQFLCDIGDGQDMENSLSTFSAHMKNVLEILRRADADSLVILDELGSGTDPAEGMGIAIAILEELRQSGCLFFATTHYPEVKEYANRHPEVINARMAFDRESLRPLYRLEIGKAGDSCALYIAKQLGVPARMLKMAAEEAYETVTPELYKDLKLDEPEPEFSREKTPSIRRRQALSAARREAAFTRGDSVTVLTEGKVGIVVTPEDEKGNVLVQIQKEKKQIPAKRLKLLVAAAELYPEDYDFSIIFDTVENRKARHQMEKRHQEGLTIVVKP